MTTARARLTQILVTSAALALLVAAGVGAAGDDRTNAEQTLRALSARPADSTLVAPQVAKARQALERAEDARAAGDHAHAGRLEAVGREWAETGRDLLRAAQVEAEASAVQQQAAKAETKAVRARALLEQTVARRGRAAARLAELERTSAPTASGSAPVAAPPKPAASAAAPPVGGAK